jgi:hypothetical protein
MWESEGRLHVWMLPSFHIRVIKVIVCLVFLESDWSESVRQDSRLIKLVASVPTIQLSEIIILTTTLYSISYIYAVIDIDDCTCGAPRIATGTSCWVSCLIEKSLEVLIVW